MDPFEQARKGNVEYFKQLDIHVLKESRNGRGDSVLCEAAMENHLECCKEIYRRSPSLLYHQNPDRENALHRTAWEGKTEMLRFLLNADAESGRVRDNNLLLAVNGLGGTPLHTAVCRGNTETAEVLIQALPGREQLCIVGHSKKTALHHAVDLKNLEIVKLLVNHAPDILYDADDNGATPLSAAMKLAEETKTSDSVNIRKLLIEKQAGQVHRSIGDDGKVLLHYAAENGDVDAIKEILQFHSDCLEVVDTAGSNFVHYAAKYGRVEVLEHILQIKDIRGKILNAQDRFGNTPLHNAASSGNQSTTLCLLYDHRVSKKVQNEQGILAVNQITFEYDKRRAGVFEREVVNEKELKDQSDFDLVVCALIATVSFTAGVTVPGGYFSDGPNLGMAVLSKEMAFKAFIITNTWALLFSLAAVFCHFCSRLLKKKKDIDLLVKLATYSTLGAIFTMVVTFTTGSFAVLAISKGLANTVCVSSGSFFVLAFWAIFKIAVQDTRWSDGRNRNNYLPISGHQN